MDKKSEGQEKVLNQIKDLGENIKNLGLKAKEKYDNSDAKTKKNIITGLAGGLALLAGLIQSKKIKNLKKKLKEAKEEDK